MILNQLQIFTEHSKTKRLTIKVNTSNLEAQGARLIKNKCQTKLLTRECSVSQQISYHWNCSIPPIWNVKPRYLSNGQISKGGGKSPQWTLFRVRGHGLRGRGGCLPLEVFLEDLLEPDRALALGLVSISAMPSERRAEAWGWQLSGLHPQGASGFATLGWDA